MSIDWCFIFKEDPTEVQKKNDSKSISSQS